MPFSCTLISRRIEAIVDHFVVVSGISPARRG